MDIPRHVLFEEFRVPISKLVNRPDWQLLRQSLVGTWAENPIANCKTLRQYMGPLATTSLDKLRIVMNYLTGTGFRTGRIKHPCIPKLRSDISKEMKRRKLRT